MSVVIICDRCRDQPLLTVPLPVGPVLDLRPPVEAAKMVVCGNPVAVARLVPRRGLQAPVRLQDGDRDMHLAVALAVQKIDVQVPLVRVLRQHGAEAQHSVRVDAVDGANPAARAGLVRPAGQRLPGLVLAARRNLGSG
jgi:hypothetical protein